MSKNQKKKPGKQKDNDQYNRPISDNSQKYEISSESEEEAPDFNYLLKQPTAPGSHFVFKGEQEKFEGDTQTFSKFFNVDIKLLNLAIKSIPFNERHEIGVEWTSEELERMKEEAKESEKVYKELLEVKSKKIEKVTKKVEKLSIEVKKKDPVKPPQSDDKKSMEKWLDDILDI